MSLTSYQKHYIKKNIKKLSPERIAANLALPPKKIQKYLEKHFPDKKYVSTSIYESTDLKISSFSFPVFFAKNLNVFIFLFLLTSISYFNSLGNSFVSDDIPSVLKNKNIGNIKSILSNFSLISIRSFFYFIFYKISGFSPYPFHILNLLFHIGSTFLVYTVIKSMSKDYVAFFTATIFAVHPILTESTTWISGGSYSQYSFFLLLSFLSYILSSGRKKYWALLFFILALTSSEKAIVFPFILVVYELSFGSLKNNWKKLVSFMMVGFLAISTLLFKLGPKISGLETTSYQEKGMTNIFLQIPIAIGSYFKLIFWPSGLTLYHTEMTFATWQYIIYLLVFLIYLAIVFISWKKNRLIFFWLFFFFITLLPTLTPLKIAWIIAERYVYLGSLGIFAVVAIIFNWLLEKVKYKDNWHKYGLYIIFTIIVLALSTRTIVRNMDWKNEDTLWLATAKTSPSGANTHNNLGDVYDRQGDLEKSAEEFKKAIELNPNYADAYHNLGNIYYKMNKFPEATEAFKKASEINPRLWESYQNLAAIYFSQGDYQKSLEAIQKALEINPDNENLKENLVLIQAKANQ